MSDKLAGRRGREPYRPLMGWVGIDWLGLFWRIVTWILAAGRLVGAANRLSDAFLVFGHS